MNLKGYLRSHQKEIDCALDRYLPKANTKPATLHKAMRYSLFAGQVADLEAEGEKVNRGQLRYIHENKTAAILTTSVRLGAMSANAELKKLRAITNFGCGLGLAFQVIDDILDVTQTSEMLGKSAGKDIATQKATYPAVIGLEKSQAEARRLTREAHDALLIFGSREADALHALANYLLEREY